MSVKLTNVRSPLLLYEGVRGFQLRIVFCATNCEACKYGYPMDNFKSAVWLSVSTTYPVKSSRSLDLGSISSHSKMMTEAGLTMDCERAFIQEQWREGAVKVRPAVLVVGCSNAHSAKAVTWRS